MPNQEDRLQQLRDIITSQDNVLVSAAEIVPQATLVDDLNIDSMDVVLIAMDLEKELDVEIPDEDLEEWTTVQDVLDFLDDQAPQPARTAPPQEASHAAR